MRKFYRYKNRKMFDLQHHCYVGNDSILHAIEENKLFEIWHRHTREDVTAPVAAKALADGLEAYLVHQPLEVILEFNQKVMDFLKISTWPKSKKKLNFREWEARERMKYKKSIPDRPSPHLAEGAEIPTRSLRAQKKCLKCEKSFTSQDTRRQHLCPLCREKIRGLQNYSSVI